MNKIAITGGLSCGKSTVCRFFREFGAYVVSADEIVHQLLSPDTSLGKKVVTLLGSDILVDGVIDRRLISAKVFDNPNKLGALESLVHPCVREEIARRYREIYKQDSHDLFVAEIPLLFEGGHQSFYDYTVAVLADPALCRKRFEEKTGYRGDEYDKRMARQWSQARKAEMADFILENHGQLEELKQRVHALYNELHMGASRNHPT